MLHHSPTFSRLRAIGQDMVSKLLRCIVWRLANCGVTFIMEASAADPPAQAKLVHC